MVKERYVSPPGLVCLTLFTKSLIRNAIFGKQFNNVSPAFLSSPTT